VLSRTEHWRRTSAISINETVAGSIAAWNKAEAERRRAATARILERGGTYTNCPKD
jgi:hypothetical protein